MPEKDIDHLKKEVGKYLEWLNSFGNEHGREFHSRRAGRNKAGLLDVSLIGLRTRETPPLPQVKDQDQQTSL